MFHLEPCFCFSLHPYNEVHAQAGLFWKVYKDENGIVMYELVGFGDDLDHELVDAEGPILADKILQYMIRSVATSFCMPVAYYGGAVQVVQARS